MQDQIQESVAPITPTGIGQATLIDAVFAGSGPFVDGLAPQPPSTTNKPLDLAGTYQLSGQLTITPPATSVPPSQISITGDGLFDQTIANPLPPP